MQNFGTQQGQALAPAIDYLNQVQRIYFDSWRRFGDAGGRWTRDAMDECNRAGQDMLHLVCDAQLALARTLGESTRASADTAREMAEHAGQAAGPARDQAQNMLQAQHGQHGKGGQDKAATVHRRAGG